LEQQNHNGINTRPHLRAETGNTVLCHDIRLRGISSPYRENITDFSSVTTALIVAQAEGFVNTAFPEFTVFVRIAQNVKISRNLQKCSKKVDNPVKMFYDSVTVPAGVAQW
jgi:hypothetical protein